MMKYSKPAKRVQLISIAADGLTVDELLTEPISSRLKWLSRGISIGDAGVGPARPLLKVFDYIPGFFEGIDLTPIEKDGLENLYLIGGDGDGHEYVVGTKTQCFYALWHDPSEFEKVATTSNAFLQWVIRERSDHLPGCPWEIFTTKRTWLKTVWHQDQVDPEPILERTRELFDWDREYLSPLGFELFDSEHEVDLRFMREHRGHNSHIQIDAPKSLPRLQTFLRWLKRRGFGNVWY